MPLSASRISLFAFASLSALGAAAQAQSISPAPPQQASGHQLKPVVVTGVRTGGQYTGQSRSALGLDLSDRETPQSVSVITRAQMDDFGLRSVNDVLANATGVTVEHFETDRSYYTARGFDITNFQFDGIGMPFTNGNQLGDLDTAVFEQVDVLRGANGLLSATGNPSATVSFIRKRPTARLRAATDLTLGSWQDRRAEGDVSGPLNESASVRGRLIAVRERTGSYLNRYGVDKAVVSGLLDVDLGSATRLSVGHLAQHNNAKNPMWGALPLHYGDGTPTDYEVSASTAPDWSHWNNTDRRTHAELTHDLGGEWRARAVVLYRTLAYDSELLYVHGTPDRLSGLGLTGDAARSVSISRQKMADLRLNGPIALGGRHHEALLGFNWGHEGTRAHTDNAESIDLPSVNLSTWDGHHPFPRYDDGAATRADFDTRRRSVYAALHLRPTDRLGIILGANANQVSGRGMNYGVVNAYGHSVLTPYAGAVYGLTDQVSLYGSFTRNFNPQKEVDAAHQVLAPIQGSNLEAGIKSEWLDQRLTASFAVFRARQEHTAEAVGMFPDFTTYYRGVDATSAGFEAEASGRPLPGWEFSAGYAQLRLKDQNGDDARTFVPRRTLRLATSWQLPAVPSLRLGASLKWQSDTHTLDDGFVIEQKAYALLDLMVRYDFNRHIKLTFNVNNSTNKKYLNSLYWKWAYYGAPRNVSATLHWSF